MDNCKLCAFVMQPNKIKVEFVTSSLIRRVKDGAMFCCDTDVKRRRDVQLLQQMYLVV